MSSPEFDPNRAEAFAERLRVAFNESAVTLMISLGRRTGLFDAMARHGPGSPAAIAARAGLQGRYVQEWLAALLTGGVVEFDLATGEYRLPPEHAAHLTDEARPSGTGWLAGLLPILAAREDAVADCFRRGGGVPHEEFAGFDGFMDDVRAQVAAALPRTVIPLVPGLDARLREGIDVLEVGCGDGRILAALAERYPNSRFRGWSDTAPAGTPGRANLRVVPRSFVEPLPEPAFDLVMTFWSLHCHPDPERALAVLRGALRPGGIYLMQDVRGSSAPHKNLGHPTAPLVYAMSCMHCLGVALSQGGEGLGAFWGEEQSLRLLRGAGFDAIDVRQTSSDFTNNYYIARSTSDV